MNHPLLDVQHLSVEFSSYGGAIKAVRDISFQVYPNETLAIVGESGCGKSVSMKAIMGLIDSAGGKITQGKIAFKDQDLLQLDKPALRHIQGNRIAYIFQDALAALNPTLTIGEQLCEVIHAHQTISKDAAKQIALKRLKQVGIAQADERFKQYAHQLSGGMRQRIVIAMALMCEPDILIADEPTTALDVTVQAQILQLFKDIQKETGVAIILITHDLGVVARMADRVIVMYAGQCVEQANIDALFSQTAHPYTLALLKSIPTLDSTELYSIAGSPPDLYAPPNGCGFTPRCQYGMTVCEKINPPFFTLSTHHQSTCWLHDPRATKPLVFTKGGATC